MDVFIAVTTALGVIVAAWLTARVSSRKNRDDAGQHMIDQHQEDIDRLLRRVGALERTVRIQGDYIGMLRRHIADNQPPPPPPWPDGLIT